MPVSSIQPAASTSVLKQLPPDSQTPTAIGPQLRNVSNQVFHQVLNTLDAHIAPYLSLKDIRNLTRTSVATSQALHERMLPARLQQALKLHQPSMQNKISALKEIAGARFPAYCERRIFLPLLAKSSTTFAKRAPWPQKHLQRIDGHTCHLQSPQGQFSVDFALVESTSRITEINIQSNGQTTPIPFPPEHYLANCGTGIPEYWFDGKPQYLTDRFQPVALLPDEKTVILLLEKTDARAVLQKMQLNEAGKWERKCTYLPKDLDISNVTGLAGTGSGKLFIYAGQSDISGKLYIGEEGSDWRSLIMPFSATGRQTIVEVAPDGSALVLMPHEAGKPPLLIKFNEKDEQHPFAYRLLPKALTAIGPTSLLYAFSPDSRYLALTTRYSTGSIEGQDKRTISMIDLNQISKKSGPPTIVDMCDENMAYLQKDISISPDFGVAFDLSSHRNNAYFEFSSDGMEIRKAVFDQDKNELQRRTFPLLGSEFDALEKQINDKSNS